MFTYVPSNPLRNLSIAEFVGDDGVGFGAELVEVEEDEEAVGVGFG